MPAKIMLVKRHAMGTTRPPNAGTLKITIQKTAPDLTSLPVWKFFRNLSGILAAVSCFRVHIGLTSRAEPRPLAARLRMQFDVSTFITHPKSQGAVAVGSSAVLGGSAKMR